LLLVQCGPDVADRQTSFAEFLRGDAHFLGGEVLGA